MLLPVLYIAAHRRPFDLTARGQTPSDLNAQLLSAPMLSSPPTSQRFGTTVAFWVPTTTWQQQTLDSPPRPPVYTLSTLSPRTTRGERHACATCTRLHMQPRAPPRRRTEGLCAARGEGHPSPAPRSARHRYRRRFACFASLAPFRTLPCGPATRSRIFSCFAFGGFIGCASACFSRSVSSSVRPPPPCFLPTGAKPIALRGSGGGFGGGCVWVQDARSHVCLRASGGRLRVQNCFVCVCVCVCVCVLQRAEDSQSVQTASLSSRRLPIPQL
jgi:hypothetical protein